MSEKFVINAQLRKDEGKGASRRLRREAGLVPGIVYGGKKKPVSIAVEFRELIKHLDDEAFYAHILELKIGEKSELVILQDLQRHPAKQEIFHFDLQRVSKTKKLHKNVPLHFINEETSVGVKAQGGKVTHSMTSVEVECLPANLPEFIEVDLAEVEAGQVVHISDIVMPKGVTSVALNHGSDHDHPIAAIKLPKGSDEDSEEAATEEAGE